MKNLEIARLFDQMADAVTLPLGRELADAPEGVAGVKAVAWLEKDQIVNTCSLKRLVGWARSHRPSTRRRDAAGQRFSKAHAAERL